MQDLAERRRDDLVQLARLGAGQAGVDDLVVPQDEAFTGVITAAIESCLWEEM